MAILVKKHHYKKSGFEQTANIYSTKAEAGNDYLTNKVDGISGYVAIGSTNDNRATVGRITKNGTKAVLSTGKPPYNKLTYTTPGTYIVTFPAGVTTAKITVAGAGGGGGGGGVGATGGTGGRGGLITQSINVASGQAGSVIVGAGGSGGKAANMFSSGGNGGTAGNSSCLGITAQGGVGGGGVTRYQDSEGGLGWVNGKNGTSYGNGGFGGSGGVERNSGSNGSPGWIIIEYGGDI